jgi:hypothetical protein
VFGKMRALTDGLHPEIGETLTAKEKFESQR